MNAERGYIHDTFVILREMAVKAHKAVADCGKADGIEAGYELALVNVLAILQQKADSFGIERATVGMDAFDPYVDVLGLKPMP
jgi:hypothetical protein